MTPAERVGNNLNGFKDFRTENGPRQGQNLALTGLCVPSSLHNGPLLTYLTKASPLISEACLETLCGSRVWQLRCPGLGLRL